MSYTIRVPSPLGDLAGDLLFAHLPGSPRPLRFQSAGTTGGRIVGQFLESVWNDQPLQLLDALERKGSCRFDAWQLSWEGSRWKLNRKGVALAIPDWSLRECVTRVASKCMADLKVDPGAPESEVPVIEHRALRLTEKQQPRVRAR